VPKDELSQLKERIKDIQARLPAHSVQPAMLQELEELEERLAILAEKKTSS
jgi:cell division protein ZapA (FtsZ GTPase activity inhibitor)